VNTLVAEHTLSLTDVEFGQLQRLIHQESGIYLNDGKRALLAGRLARRVRELGLPSYGAYYRAVIDGDGAELVRMLDAIATNETSFFRESRQFDFLADRVCPLWVNQAADGLRSQQVRVWSAACSTGEEPYTLAMLLHHRLASAGMHVDVTASDISTRALDRAQAGVYPAERTERIPRPLLHAYMQRGVGPEMGRVRAGAELRRMVRFQRLNLQDEHYPVAGAFDAIFCRNVLIYFDPAARERVIGRLLSHLAPGGYLFLGHAESLTARAHAQRPQSVMPAVYQVPGHPPASKAA